MSDDTKNDLPIPEQSSESLDDSNIEVSNTESDTIIQNVDAQFEQIPTVIIDEPNITVNEQVVVPEQPLSVPPEEQQIVIPPKNDSPSISDEPIPVHVNLPDNVTPQSVPETAQVILETPPSNPSKNIQQKVQDLTPQELEAAKNLWNKQNFQRIQKMGSKAMHDHMEQNILIVLDYLKAHPHSKVITIASACNLHTAQTSYYLKHLRDRRLVTATGATNSRRYNAL